MVDHVVPEVAGLFSWSQVERLDPKVRARLLSFLWKVREASAGATIACIGTGPDTTVWLPKEAMDGV